MSKASEWDKGQDQWERTQPRVPKFRVERFIAEVGSGSSDPVDIAMVKQSMFGKDPHLTFGSWSTDPRCALTAAEALQLAQWIIETFGDGLKWTAPEWTKPNERRGWL